MPYSIDNSLKVWRKFKPWVGGCAFIILAILFWKFQNQQEQSLEWPHGLDLLYFILLLPLVTLFKMLAWHRITQVLNISISLDKSIGACLMSIAGRYVPGKILFVLGRIEAYGPEPNRMSIAGFGMIIEFIVENCAACLLLLCAALLGQCPEQTGFWLGASAIFVILAVFSTSLLRTIIELLPRSIRPQNIPNFKSSQLIAQPLILTFGHWASYLGCIYLMYGVHLNLSPLQMIGIGAALSLSSLAGTLSILTPGGLGVRESIATLLFSALGLNPADAFLLAMAARITIWASELYLALPAIIWSLLKKKYFKPSASHDSI